MKRNAFKMQLKEGFVQEYQKRHHEIWPEIVEILKKSGISDYSIYFDEETNSLFAFQKQDGMTQVFLIIYFIYQADAGCGAALDLVLQTGPRAVFEKTVFTLADGKQLLQQVESLPHRTGAGIRTKITALGPLGATMQRQTRKLVIARTVNIGITLVIPVQYVVARP